eukprot:3895168-Pyramimonas_sp.AAC.1
MALITLLLNKLNTAIPPSQVKANSLAPFQATNISLLLGRPSALDRTARESLQEGGLQLVTACRLGGLAGPQRVDLSAGGSEP